MRQSNPWDWDAHLIHTGIQFDTVIGLFVVHFIYTYAVHFDCRIQYMYCPDRCMQFVTEQPLCTGRAKLKFKTPSPDLCIEGRSKCRSLLNVYILLGNLHALA